MTSAIVTRVNALLLFAAGILLLFASDRILPSLVAGYPAGGVWVGQVLSAAFLGFAALNWLQRRTPVGGIYGRPLVIANLTLYLVSAMSLVRLALDGSAARAFQAIVGVLSLMAVLYLVLLFRGPFDSREPAPKPAK